MTSNDVPLRVGYMMSRFPKLTETFILDEMLEMERRGVSVEIFPLWRENASTVHPEARPLVERARFSPMLNGRIAVDNLRCLLQRPWCYLSTLFTLFMANWRSPWFLLVAIAIFPKACSFSQQMRRLGVQHVHAHFASHPAAAAFIIGRMSGIPWSFTAHGSDLHKDQSMLKEKVSESAFTVTISEYNRRFILERVGANYADKVKVVHCGVTLGRFERTTSEHSGIQLICIGTLHEVKGQRYLIEACALLQQRGIEFVCNLVGDGPDRKQLEDQAAALGIDKQVVFHGACERERVWALLGQMDVAVAPSVPTADGRREGIPVALMEAAACGLPLVASRLSGIPELVSEGENGYLADPGDVEALAEAIAQIAQTPSLAQQLGDAARQRMETEFNLKITAAKLQQLMQNGASA